ncbi:glycosyltransferase [Flavobacterium suncheonense]|uniref:glycosyltransferase n=1 Tax=Flavobacterium suncheonense TaxID=350894 RepID=UPI00041E757B|nr:glycosyltransferase [Flavobacterium suncheonense]
MVIPQKKNLKIALVGYKLAEGGLERMLGLTSAMFQSLNFDVHLIVLEDNVTYSFKGKLVNLGHYPKYRKYFRLRKYVSQEKFDYVVDFRHRINPFMELVFVFFIYFRTKFIYTIHSSRLETYLTDKVWVANFLLRKAHSVVVVSKGLYEKLKTKYHFEKAIVIPNFIDVLNVNFNHNELSLPFEYCIAVGRLTELKQFDKLIESYQKSLLPEKGIHLVILGKGEKEHKLHKQIKENNLEGFVHLLGFKENAYFYIKNAKFLVLSSQYEGFPLVILESLSFGKPVIAFNCPTGPSEMVIDGENGFLVENQNFEALTSKMNTFAQNQILYQSCCEKAKSSVSRFEKNEVAQQWLELLEK